jgi:hypothetical protein
VCDRVVNEKLESEMECISMSEKVWFTSCTRSTLMCECIMRDISWGLCPHAERWYVAGCGLFLDYRRTSDAGQTI